MSPFLILSSKRMHWVHLLSRFLARPDPLNMYTIPLWQNGTTCLISFSTAGIFITWMALETCFSSWPPAGPRNPAARTTIQLGHLTDSQEQSWAHTPGPVCVWPKWRRIGMAGWSRRTTCGRPVLETMSIQSSVRFLINWVIPKRVKTLYPILDWLFGLARVNVETA